MEFIGGIKKIILDVKIYFKLNFIYPGKSKYKKIRSVIPATVKSLGDYISIEKNVEIDESLEILNDGLYVGKGTYIGSCSAIGKFCSISYDVKIGVASHPLNYISTSPVFYAKRRGWVDKNNFNEQANGNVEIGNDVLISANVIIVAGVKIGNGAVIGAGAFVNTDIPPYAIAVGIPAKVIKYRFSEDEIKKLEASNWWNRSKEELMKHKEFFNNPIQLIERLNANG